MLKRRTLFEASAVSSIPAGIPTNAFEPELCVDVCHTGGT